MLKGRPESVCERESVCFRVCVLAVSVLSGVRSLVRRHSLVCCEVTDRNGNAGILTDFLVIAQIQRLGITEICVLFYQ